jgi:hypothetical protein
MVLSVHYHHMRVLNKLAVVPIEKVGRNSLTSSLILLLDDVVISVVMILMICVLI